MKRKTLALIPLFAMLPNNAFADNAATIEEISKKIASLEQELAILKRQQEVSAEQVKSDNQKNAKVELGRKGLKIASPDKKYEISLHGNFQFDGRSFINDDNNTGKDEFLVRQARPILDGKSGNASFRLVPDFGATAKVMDVHADYEITEAANIRIGKFKPPIGLERYQSSMDNYFMELGQPSNLSPNRDVGLMAFGSDNNGIFEYQLGIFNGAADNVNADTDGDDKKDLVARVFSHPLQNSSIVSLQGLGVGIGSSIGERDGSASNTLLSTYKTFGQQDFFTYRSGTYANGKQWRLSPQGYWYNENYGLLTEYAISSQEITNSNKNLQVSNTAWQVAGSYVITGEDVNFRGGVKPDADFNPDSDGWGAFEITTRYGQTDIDDAVFNGFSDANVSASNAKSMGAGLNWYLSENLKWMLNYENTIFDGGAKNNGDRPDEQAMFTRVQVRF